MFPFFSILYSLFLLILFLRWSLILCSVDTIRVLKQSSLSFFDNSKPELYFEQTAGWISVYIEFSFSFRTNITCTLGVPIHLPTALVSSCKATDNVDLISGYARMRKHLRTLKYFVGLLILCFFRGVPWRPVKDPPKRRFINSMTNVPLCSPIGHMKVLSASTAFHWQSNCISHKQYILICLLMGFDWCLEIWQVLTHY